MDDQNLNIANGIGSAAEKALTFIEKTIAGPVIEGTGVFTDKVKYWRFKNQVNIIIRAKAFLKEKGIETPKKVPFKDITTLLEYASFEEEEVMQDSWAKLLSNALNPDNKFNTTYIFSQVLNQLSIDEIKILNLFFNNCFIKNSEDRPYFKKQQFLSHCVANYETTLLLIDNMLRLKLIEEEPPVFKYQEPTTSNDDYGYVENKIVASENYRLSKFGVELLRQIRN